MVRFGFCSYYYLIVKGLLSSGICLLDNVIRTHRCRRKHFMETILQWTPGSADFPYAIIFS